MSSIFNSDKFYEEISSDKLYFFFALSTCLTVFLMGFVKLISTSKEENTSLNIWSLISKIFKMNHNNVEEENENLKPQSTNPLLPKYHSLFKIYLTAYLLAMFSDWLQGPYVYALYASYGYSKADNGVLFVAGFGSSLIFGTVVGSLADKYGRKRFAILYCIFYCLSCMTKHFDSFYILLIGRILGGISTSLLFSVFDSWIACEYDKLDTENKEHNYSNLPHISQIFSSAIFGNSLVAISAGVIAQWATDVFSDKVKISSLLSGSSVYIGGFCCPFDVAIIVLIFCGFYISIYWSENYGESNSSSTSNQSSSILSISYEGVHRLKTGLSIIYESTQLSTLGVLSFTFESSMFVFVFLWTPAITSSGSLDSSISFGLIFALFMTMVMCGSQIFVYLRNIKAYSLEFICVIVLISSFICHLTVAYLSIMSPKSTFSILMAFMAYEMSVGVYFPAIFSLKAERTPEESRSTIYSIYRVPLNAIVVSTLLLDVSVSTGFLITSSLLGMSLWYWLYGLWSTKSSE